MGFLHRGGNIQVLYIGSCLTNCLAATQLVVVRVHLAVRDDGHCFDSETTEQNLKLNTHPLVNIHFLPSPGCIPPSSSEPLSSPHPCLSPSSASGRGGREGGRRRTRLALSIQFPHRLYLFESQVKVMQLLSNFFHYRCSYKTENFMEIQEY